MSEWRRSRCGRSWERFDGHGRLLGYVARSLFGDWVAVCGTHAIAKGGDGDVAALCVAIDERLSVQGAPISPVLTGAPPNQH